MHLKIFLILLVLFPSLILASENRTNTWVTSLNGLSKEPTFVANPKRVCNDKYSRKKKKKPYTPLFFPGPIGTPGPAGATGPMGARGPTGPSLADVYATYYTTATSSNLTLIPYADHNPVLSSASDFEIIDHNQVRILKSGIYLVNFEVNQINNNMILCLEVNGVVVPQSALSGIVDGTANRLTLVQLTANDVLTIRVLSGGTVDLSDTGAISVCLTIIKIH